MPPLVCLPGNAAIAMSPAQLTELGTNFGTDPVGVDPFMYDSTVAGDSITVPAPRLS